MGYYESIRVNEYKCCKCGHCFDDQCHSDLFKRIGSGINEVVRREMYYGEFIPIAAVFCPFCTDGLTDVCYN